MPIKLFFCYAREDEELLEKLKSHLQPLIHEGAISTWHDRDINAGAEWEQEINKHLDEAQIILLLISPSFMNSKYCYSIEMKKAMEKHKRKEAHVIPIILEHVYWQISPLREIQVLPSDAKPVQSASWHNENEALYNVTEGIRKIVEQLSRESTVRRVVTYEKARKKPLAEPFVAPERGNLQQNMYAKTSSLSQNQPEQLKSVSLFSILYRHRKLAMQKKNLILILSGFDSVLLLVSFFLPLDSPVPLVAIFVAASIFIFSLIDSALLDQWYWFAGILLFNPLTGFIYYRTYPNSAPLTIKWWDGFIQTYPNSTPLTIKYWFVGSILLTLFIGVGYVLFGPKKKPDLSVTQTAFRGLILTYSFIGIFALIVAGSLLTLWLSYIGFDFYAVGYILAIIQVFRLKHEEWVGERIMFIIFWIPLLLFGILYAIFSPSVEEN